MNKYKNTEIEWIGKIPLSWNLYTIGSIFRVRNEKVNDVDYPPLSVSRGGVVPQLENVAKSDASDNRKLVLKNDFAINSRSDRKQSCGVSPLDGSVSLINIVLYSIDKNIILPEYPKYLLKNYGFAEEFYRWGHGIVADLWTTRWQEMKNIILPVPSIKIQAQIIDILKNKEEQISQLIRNNEEQIEKLKEYKQSLITKVCINGLNNNITMKNSSLEYPELIPETWEVNRLKNLGWFMSGISNKKPEDFGHGYPFVSYKNISKNFEIDPNCEEKVKSTVEDRTKYNIKYGDLFFTGSSETIDELGFSSVAMQDIKDAVWNGFCIRFRPYSFEKYYPKYFLYLTRSDFARSYFNANDNSITRANLSQKRLGNLDVIIPSLSEQKEISDYLDMKCLEIDKLILIKQQKIIKLQEYKKSLIYEYVTGKREVKEG